MRLSRSLSAGWRRYETAARRVASIYDDRPPSRAAIEGIAVYVLGGALTATIGPPSIGSPSRDWLIYGPF